MAIHSDMQGPCPNGFHVPLSSEWTTVKSYMDVILEGAIGNIGTNFSNFLKLPFAGKKYRNTGNIGEKTTLANYWSSTYSGNTVSVFYMTSTTISPDDGEYSSAGLSIRPFKDSPVGPKGEGWVKITAGSFAADALWYNESLGLFSLTRRNLPTITIADKNVGATTVWNSGDALSEENCGKYYQWGNNYGFSRNGGGTTSSTQVDASAYGPGNYYESDTFIMRSSDGWDSSVNRNLRGGVSQGTWETPDPIKLHGAIQTFHFQPTLLDISALKEFPEEEGLFFNTPNVYGIVEELNKHPQVYYAKFLGENNLYSAYGKTNVLGNGEGAPYIVTETFKGEPYKYIAFYNTETMKREVYSEYGGLSTDV